MSVSNRKKRDQSNGLTQLVRTFFQSYDEANPPDHIAAIRQLPFGAVVSFFTEQILWRGQRNLFGITLVEVKRLVEAARGESEQLRRQMAALESELTQVRALARSRA